MIASILAYGSRGDVQPAIALARGLVARGHEVRLLASPSFAHLAAGRGVDFRPLDIDIQEDLGSKQGRRLLAGGAGRVALARWMASVARRHVMNIAPQVRANTEGSHVIVGSGVMDPFASIVARYWKAPCVHFWMQPNVPTRDFLCPVMVDPRREFPGWLNKWGYRAIQQAAWMFLRPLASGICKSYGLPPPDLSWNSARGGRRGETLLHAYSEALAPRPRDWPNWAEVTGFWFLDRDEDWRPPEDLQRFIEAGPPPLYVGFGSTVAKDAKATLETALAALRIGKIRAVMKLVEGMDPALLPDHVRQIGVAPFDWLFPRMSAIVHHGGAGTTAAALRAGKPSLAIPFMADQFFWARQLRRRGLAPPVAPRERLTAGGFGAAVDALLGDPELRRRTEEAGARVRAEDGLGRAITVVERRAAEGAGA